MLKVKQQGLVRMENAALPQSYVSPKIFCLKSIKTGFITILQIDTNFSRHLGSSLDVHTLPFYVTWLCTHFNLDSKNKKNFTFSLDSFLAPRK